MVRSNNSRFAILGFLLDRPRSGYAIRKAIKASLGNFWNESFGQIYPTLKALEQEGLVARVQDSEGGHMNRQTYLITEPGRLELRQWLREPAAPLVYRVETLVKVFFSGLIGPLEGRAHVARFRAEHLERLENYRSILAKLEKERAAAPGFPYWKLTLECGLAVGKAYVDWCDAAEATLARLEQGETL